VTSIRPAARWATPSRPRPRGGGVEILAPAPSWGHEWPRRAARRRRRTR
jgi:hypothetical protein